MTTLEARAFSPAMAQLSTLPNVFGRGWQDHHNDVGSWNLSVGLSEADLAHLADDNIVRFYLDGVARWQGLIEHSEQATVAPDEEKGQVRQYKCRGTAALWERAIVYPPVGGVYLPLDQRRAVRLRRFDYTAADFDQSAWTAPVQVPSIPFPNHWPDSSAQWIWTRARDANNSHPPGFCYFRTTLTLTSETRVGVFATADDTIEVFVNEEKVIDETRTPYLWMQTRHSAVTLPAGTHQIAVRAGNGPGTIGNPAYMLLSVVTLNANGDPTTTVLKRSQVSGWVCRDYPATTPGQTPGKIVRKLLAEAKARFPAGDIFQGLTVSFSDTADSNGAAWVHSPDFTVDMETNYLDVLRRLSAESDFDWWMDATALTLHARNSRGTDRSTDINTVVFSPALSATDTGANTLKADHSGGRGEVVNAALGEYGDHWIERTNPASITAYGRREVGVSAGDAETPDAAARVIDAVFAARAQPTDAITLELRDTVGARPYIDYGVGDWVLAPNRSRVATRFRVIGVTISEDADGNLAFAPELDAIDRDRIERMLRNMRAAYPGLLDGSVEATTPLPPLPDIPPVPDFGVGDLVGVTNDLPDPVPGDVVGIGEDGQITFLPPGDIGGGGFGNGFVFSQEGAVALGTTGRNIVLTPTTITELAAVLDVPIGSGSPAVTVAFYKNGTTLIGSVNVTDTTPVIVTLGTPVDLARGDTIKMTVTVAGSGAARVVGVAA